MTKGRLHHDGIDLPETGPSNGVPISTKELNCQLESRMRENRLSGSEGGEGVNPLSPTLLRAAHSGALGVWRA